MTFEKFAFYKLKFVTEVTFTTHAEDFKVTFEIERLVNMIVSPVISITLKDPSFESSTNMFEIFAR